MIKEDQLEFINVDENDCAIIIIQYNGDYMFALIGNGWVLENCLSTLLIENKHIRNMFRLAVAKYILTLNK